LDDKPTYTINLREIETNHIGIGELMKFYAFAKQHRYCGVQLNISPANSMDANLSALLLAIAHKLKVENKVHVFLLLADHMNVFFRNGLIAHLQGKGNANPYEDNRQSTIPLTSFLISDDESFCEYLRRDFFGHRGLENLTNTVKTNLSTHFEEIFVNVVQHANTTYPVFTCGQYFPEKNILKFTLVDLGDGFLKKIAEKTEGEVATDNAAILWATYNLNTTKDVITYGPGGTGLKELKRYCEQNNGSFHICSGKGYLNFLKDKTFEYNLPEPLQGSLVNLIFRNI
jgi:hypothetical protein